MPPATRTIAITGHRPSKLGGYSPQAESRLVAFATAQIAAQAPSLIITGMAQGWDQAIVRAAIACRVPFIAAVPFAGQESQWPPAAQSEYRHLLRAAAEVTIISPGAYSPHKMQLRNEWMIDRAAQAQGQGQSQGQLLALWDGSPGGTANAIHYAIGKLPIINLWPQWISQKETL